MWVLPLLVCLAAPVAASITVGDQGSPDSSGTEFIIGFMDKGRTCKHQYVRLFITTASTENVQVQVDLTFIFLIQILFCSLVLSKQAMDSRILNCLVANINLGFL